jgi:hypothetical protein
MTDSHLPGDAAGIIMRFSATSYRFVAEFRDGKRRRRKGYRPAWAAFLD